MPRFPKPWYRADRNAWFVQVDGRQVKLGHDKDEALRRYHDLMAAPRGQVVAAKSVVELLDQFLEWTKLHRAKRTYDFYRERCQGFIQAISSTLSIKELRPFHIHQWVDSHVGWASGMKRGCIQTIQRAFNWAEKQGLIDRSPVRHVEKPSAGKRTTVIAMEQYEELLNLVKNNEFRDVVTVAWETGARPQEILRVERRHFDVTNSRWVFPPHEAKVKSRPRIVYLSPVALEITKRLSSARSQGPMFVNTKGKPWHPYAISCTFERLKKKIGRRLCLYNFRHTFATRMLEAGVDPLTVAILLGHANPAMLSTTYQHLSLNPQHLLTQLNRPACG